MAPKITRPRSDRAYWPVAAACGVAALVGGYVGAAKVFRPAVQPASGEGDEGAEPDPGASAAGGADAGTGGATAEPATPQAAAVAPAPPPPRVRVRVVRAVLQSCGDGEELTTPGERCEPVAGLEEALRAHLPQLGNCPSAEQAAVRTPDATLSIGLRVDFARRRVTALPGRSSSVRDPLTYVPCARAAMEHADELWRLTAPHPRYLMFFMVRFGPGLEPGGAATPPPGSGSGAAADAGAATPTTTGTPSAADTPGAAGSGASGETPGTPAPANNGASANSANSAGSAGSANNAGSTPSASGASDAGAPAAAGGVPDAVPLRRPETVQVAWDRALIRETPQTGAVRARLSRGTELTAVARVGSWYQVRWPGGEGWVFGEAIGR